MAAQQWRNAQQVLAAVRKLVPALSWTRHKGQAGRIGVVGGCFEYTGAPYYAAMATLKCGGDLATVFCTPDAAVPIKCYSPELIVHGVLPASGSASGGGGGLSPAALAAADAVSANFPRLHALVVGPGLGRDPVVLEAAGEIIARARAAALPVVIDADGLWLVAQDVGVLRRGGAAHGGPAVLTPNVVEFRRLCAAVGVAAGDDPAAAAALAAALGHVCVLRKGPRDAVADGAPGGAALVVDEEGSPRRPGGQGDVLAGAVATFLAWAAPALRAYGPPAAGPAAAAAAAGGDGAAASGGGDGAGAEAATAAAAATAREAVLLAAYGGCVVTRRAARGAFARHRRATTTPDIIAEVGNAMESLAPYEAVPPPRAAM